MRFLFIDEIIAKDGAHGFTMPKAAPVLMQTAISLGRETSIATTDQTHPLEFTIRERCARRFFLGEHPLIISTAKKSMSTPSLDSVRQKIYRVKLHFEELQTELYKYFLKNPGAMVPEPDSPSGNPTFSFQAREPIPARFGLIIGDCLQDLRSSLDYLVLELVLVAGNEPARRNMFPICSSLNDFDAALKGKRLRGVDPDAIAVIKDLQPFHLRADHKKDFLWVLNELTNISKHRRGLRIILGSSVIPETTPQDAWNYGSVLDRDEKPRFMAVKSSRDAKVNAKLGAFMAFNEEPVKGESVTTCLEMWAEYVNNKVIHKFQRFFH